MASDAYVTKCLRTKRKAELLDLGRVLGVPVRKSWTKERIIGSVSAKYEEDPGILLLALSAESAAVFRKRLRNPDQETVLGKSAEEELSFLGLAASRCGKARKRGKPVEGDTGPVEDGGAVGEEVAYSLFAASGAGTFLVKKRQAGWIRRLDTMEKVIRGMLRVYGLLAVEDLTAMVAACFLEDFREGGRRAPSTVDGLEKEAGGLVRRRLSLRTFIRTYEDGKRAYLHHPSVTNPERLQYSIMASPVGNYRTFSLSDLVRLGEGGEASGAAYLGLLDLLKEHPYRKKGRTCEEPAEASTAEDGPCRMEAEAAWLRPGSQGDAWRDGMGWEEEILHIKLRIREGAPNLEIVREVMERLSFEDHQAVSRFLERFISHCDDIPRWTLKGYRMNEI